MVDFDIKLTRRRVLASILVIGLAAAAAGVGTFALFTEQQTTDNTITAGNMQLTTPNAFSADGLYPGQTTGNQSTNLSYSGPQATLNISDVGVSGQGNSLDWSGNLTVVNGYLEVNGNAVETYTNVDLSALEVNDAATLSGGETIDLIVDLKLDQSAGNAFQGEGANIDVTFNASQTP